MKVRCRKQLGGQGGFEGMGEFIEELMKSENHETASTFTIILNKTKKYKTLVQEFLTLILNIDSSLTRNSYCIILLKEFIDKTFKSYKEYSDLDLSVFDRVFDPMSVDESIRKNVSAKYKSLRDSVLLQDIVQMTTNLVNGGIKKISFEEYMQLTSERNIPSGQVLKNIDVNLNPKYKDRADKYTMVEYLEDYFSKNPDPETFDKFQGVLAIGKQIYKEVLTPDLDADDVFGHVVKMLKNLKKEIRGVNSKVFNIIESSGKLFSEKFPTYYKNIQKTSNVTGLLTDFISDIISSVSDGTDVGITEEMITDKNAIKDLKKFGLQLKMLIAKKTSKIQPNKNNSGKLTKIEKMLDILGKTLEESHEDFAPASASSFLDAFRQE